MSKEQLLQVIQKRIKHFETIPHHGYHAKELATAVSIINRNVPPEWFEDSTPSQLLQENKELKHQANIDRGELMELAAMVKELKEERDALKSLVFFANLSLKAMDLETVCAGRDNFFLECSKHDEKYSTKQD